MDRVEVGVIMGTIYYAVTSDVDMGCLIVILGSAEEIADGNLSGQSICGSRDQLVKLADDLGDTGSSCEDYVLASAKYIEESQIPEVKRIVEGYGFVEDERLLDCGWG